MNSRRNFWTTNWKSTVVGSPDKGVLTVARKKCLGGGGELAYCVRVHNAKSLNVVTVLETVLETVFGNYCERTKVFNKVFS